MKGMKKAAISALLAPTLLLTSCAGKPADNVGTGAEMTESTVTETSTAAETSAEETVTEETADETSTAAETYAEETEKAAENLYQVPDWDSIDYADEADFDTIDLVGGIAMDLSDFETANSGGCVAITNYHGNETAVKIPETINGKKVVQIGTTYIAGGFVTDLNPPFANSPAVDIKIPDSVTKIHMYSFYGCIYLKSVTIPDSVDEIEAMAFCDCTRLVSINIPDSLKEIDGTAFRSCSSLTEINLPENITLTPDENDTGVSFYGCSSLKSFDIPYGVTYIGNIYSFEKCHALENVTIPDSVTEIDWEAFCDCESLKKLTIPDSVTRVDSCAFLNCSEDLEVTYKGVTYKYSELPELYALFE